MMAFSHSMGQMIFLLTPLREGRPGAWQSNGTLRNISTHAPAGGATRALTPDNITDPISTHAPAGGATPGGQSSGRAVEISTHAPAGGAT